MKYLLHLIIACWLLPAAAQSEDFADLESVRGFAIDMQERHGFSAAALLRDFHQVRALPAVLRAIAPPADPGIRSWKSYRSRFIEPGRIAAGIAFRERHQAALAHAQRQYGVPAEIILGILGVETLYGRMTGGFQTFAALATLAFHYPPRADLFRKELEALLLLAREEGRDPLSYRGSYAGALGLPQFLPSSTRNWAVDFDGDGKIDLAGSAADAIGSIAHYLAEHGWVAGGPILAPARAQGERIAELLTEGIAPRRTPQAMAEFGVEAEGAPEEPAALIDLVTPGEPTEYRLGFRNFYVLTRYNRSSFYATAVADLAVALKEGMQE